jgi:hypothetical protein
MRTAGVFVLAFVASAAAGTLAFAASSLLPDWDDAAGRGLGEAFRVLLIALYMVFSIIVYSFAAWRSERERHLKRGLRILCLVPLLIPVLGLINNGVQHLDWPRESVGAVQMFAPLWIVALSQWLILHMYLSRRAAPAEIVSTGVLN